MGKTKNRTPLRGSFAGEGAVPLFAVLFLRADRRSAYRLRGPSSFLPKVKGGSQERELTYSGFPDNPIWLLFSPFSNQKCSAKYSSEDLEVFWKEMLEKVRWGKSLSFENEKALRKIKAILAINSGVNQILVERLIAMIDNILEINSELIHPEDGNHQTDGD